MVNPCDNEVGGDAWPGVGHRNVAGGGARNPFGLDFASNQFVRTEYDSLVIVKHSLKVQKISDM